MANIDLLTSQAITASTQANWNEGVTLNEQILELEPQNIGALNRAAFCYMQLGNFSQAKKYYNQVIELEKFNTVANKYIAILKQKDKPIPKVLATTYQDFIEEPGKTKSVSLQRLADPDVLQTIATATPCVLIAKNHRINVQTENGMYLGCLPDDITFRLLKLIGAGNTYSAHVQSSTKKSCIVFIREKFHAKNSPYATPFPLGSGQRGISIQEDVLLDEAPLDTRETGNESEEIELEETPDPME